MREQQQTAIEAETVTYTSLRDVIPSSMASPVDESKGRGRRRIGGGGAAIRNPLVMQAALAYLQPVGVGGRMGGNEYGCTGCFNGIVLAVLRTVFGKRKGGAEDDGDDDDDEEEDDEDFFSEGWLI